MQTTVVAQVGKVAAILSALFAIIYSVFQLVAVFKIMPHPDELFWLFLPSILLAPPFLVVTICLHYTVGEENKIFTAMGVAFATLYSAFVMIVYFTQLAVVIPQLQQGKIDETHLLAFTDKSFMVAVDCIGYTFMNAATLSTAFAFRRKWANRWFYRSLLANGLLTPVMVAAFFIPGFMFLGAFWMITFPVAMVQAIFYFGKKGNVMFQYLSSNETVAHNIS